LLHQLLVGVELRADCCRYLAQGQWV